MNYIFITGLHRSGTTLVEKIIQNHPNIFIASQPSPFLFYDIKNIFLKKKNISQRYPLSHFFGESNYDLNNFYNFLNFYKISRQDINKIFEHMEGFGGHWTPELIKFKDQIKEGTFYDVFLQICYYAFRLFPKNDIKYCGSKEIMCEEFAPFFLSKGCKVLIVIRDPRDIIASTNFGKDLGEIRPTLFYLRNWRKSIAFVSELEENNNFMFITYENLVYKPFDFLDKIVKFFNIDPYPKNAFKTGIPNQNGKKWKGNSSFQEYSLISTSSVNNFKKKLTKKTIEFIESFCYPEMILFDYKCLYINKNNYNKETISKQKEPFNIIRKDFPSDYSHSNVNLDNEISRLKYLKSENTPSLEEQKKWFIFTKAYQKLKNKLYTENKV